MSLCVVFSLKMLGKLIDPLNAVSLDKNVTEQLDQKEKTCQCGIRSTANYILP